MPGDARSRRVYALNTGRDDAIHVDELRAGARRVVLTVPRDADVDVAGHIALGPDRLLYVSVAFGRTRETAQELDWLTGKLLRIDPRPAGGRQYSGPADNPFVGRPDARHEIWAYGLRVPWRFSFDRLRGDLALGDVGESTIEEIDFLPRGTGAGANFGWPVMEGDRPTGLAAAPPGLTAPVLTHRHGSGGFCALIGGHVVRDRALRGLYGRYLYGDLCRGRMRSARLRVPRARGDRAEPFSLPGLTSFGEDARGRVYAASLLGAVYRLSA